MVGGVMYTLKDDWGWYILWIFCAVAGWAIGDVIVEHYLDDEIPKCICVEEGE
jgi:hypothetical protein